VAITRLTIRNASGDIVHDSGPAVSVPHPLNIDTVPAQDITTIAPGATHYLTTTHIWGNFPVPDPVLGRVGGGSSMSVSVEYFTEGKAEFVITTGLRVRERIQSSPGVFVQGQEKARTSRLCDQLK
jgi:hypothetical protein